MVSVFDDLMLPLVGALMNLSRSTIPQIRGVIVMLNHGRECKCNVRKKAVLFQWKEITDHEGPGSESMEGSSSLQHPPRLYYIPSPAPLSLPPTTCSTNISPLSLSNIYSSRILHNTSQNLHNE